MLAASCTHDDVARPLLIQSQVRKFSRTDAAAVMQGKLRFRGGVRLSSPDGDFGGVSALLVSADGARFVGVSDEAHWLTGSLEYQDGNLVRVSGETIAPLLDTQGRPLSSKSGDAEGLASTSGNDISGDLLVSFEGEHRVWRYPFDKGGVLAVPVNVAVPAELHSAPHNGGLEGITLFSDGLFFAVSERYRDAAGDYRAWVLPLEAAASPQQTTAATGRAVSIKPMPPFAMTDIRRLPGGDLLTLERRYSPAKGVGIQLRRIAGAAVYAASRADKAKALDGEVVANFDATYEIDNMEGLAIRTGSNGETLVYAISDDNFNRPVQATLLLMYELLP